MANEPNKAAPVVNEELDDLAFEIYKERVGRGLTRRNGEHEAAESYRRAEAFLAVRKKVRAGELKPTKEEGPQLAESCAPNLPRTHPINLVARVHIDRKGVETPGNLDKIRRIKDWLDKNPTPEDDPERLVHQFGREFHDLGWDLPKINTARAIFGAYTAKN